MFGVVALAGCGSGGATRAATANPSSSSASAGAVGVRVDPTLGPIVVDGQGITLYANTTETADHIVCGTGCTSAWLPLLVSAGAPAPAAGAGVTGTLATATRPDGTVQVTYDGAPLYRFVNDHQPGDINGQGADNIWFAVPATATAATAAATTATTIPSIVTTTAPPTTATPQTTVAPTTTAPPNTTMPPTTKPTSTTVCLYPPCY